MKHAEGFTCWELLALIPTADERAIKSAYARALREAGGPEVMDPDDFQMLREAYEKCLVESEKKRAEKKLTLSRLGGLFGSAFGGFSSGVFDDTFALDRCTRCGSQLIMTHDQWVCSHSECSSHRK